MLQPSTNDPAALALQALAATLADDRRAQRFLDLTGLDADTLRAGLLAGDPELPRAAIAFLAGHEPDLLAVADLLGVAPAALVALAPSR